MYEQGVLVQYIGHGHQQVTLGSTAQGLPVPAVAWSRIRRVVVRNLGQPIDWTADGNNPDGITSFKSLADEIVVLDTDFENFRMIVSPGSAGNADVRVAYFGT